MAEIRRSPVEVGSLSRYLQGFIHPRWLFRISEPSTVVALLKSNPQKPLEGQANNIKVAHLMVQVDGQAPYGESSKSPLTKAPI